MKHTKTFNFLEFKPEETAIIQVLSNGASSTPTYISRQSGVKRTTVNFLLNKLLKRGVIKQIKVNNHFEWQLNDNVKLKRMIDGLYDFFNQDITEGTINIPSEIGVEVFKGKDKILKVYEKILLAGQNSRVFAIQGNKSIAASIMIEKSYLMKIQKEFKKHKIIIEGIIGEQSLKYLESQDIELLMEYQNRMVVAYIADDRFMDFDLDVLIFQKLIIMINYEKRLIIIIKNEAVYSMLFNLFEVLKIVSKKINLNDYITKLVETKKQKS